MLCCTDAVIFLIMQNNCESVWNVYLYILYIFLLYFLLYLYNIVLYFLCISFYCISGERIPIQVSCISDTDTRHHSQNVSIYKIQNTFFVS